MISMKSDNMPIELLAPAKNLACGIEAINHGADAVYIGAPRFGAGRVQPRETRWRTSRNWCVMRICFGRVFT